MILTIDERGGECLFTCEVFALTIGDNAIHNADGDYGDFRRRNGVYSYKNYSSAILGTMFKIQRIYTWHSLPMMFDISTGLFIDNGEADENLQCERESDKVNYVIRFSGRGICISAGDSVNYCSERKDTSYHKYPWQCDYHFSRESVDGDGHVYEFDWLMYYGDELMDSNSHVPALHMVRTLLAHPIAALYGSFYVVRSGDEIMTNCYELADELRYVFASRKKSAMQIP